jgi:hypothetical protein
MIARGDAIGVAALSDTGPRVLPNAWQGPALPLPSKTMRGRVRRVIARR